MFPTAVGNGILIGFVHSFGVSWRLYRHSTRRMVILVAAQSSFRRDCEIRRGEGCTWGTFRCLFMFYALVKSFLFLSCLPARLARAQIFISLSKSVIALHPHPHQHHTLILTPFPPTTCTSNPPIDPRLSPCRALARVSACQCLGEGAGAIT